MVLCNTKVLTTSLEHPKWGSGIPIHTKMQFIFNKSSFIAICINSCILSVLNNAIILPLLLSFLGLNSYCLLLMPMPKPIRICLCPCHGRGLCPPPVGAAGFSVEGPGWPSTEGPRVPQKAQQMGCGRARARPMKDQ